MSRLSSIRESLESLGQGAEPFRSGSRFVPLPDKAAIDLGINARKRGLERGANDLPPVSTTSADEVESKILEVYQESVTTTAARVNETVATYNARIAAIDLTTYMDDIYDTCRSLIEDFKAQITADEGMLKQKYLPILDKENDFKVFKADAGIRRSPKLPSPRQQQAMWFVIIALFVIESVANAGFLSVGNRGGLVSAYIEALAFSALNIGLAILAGNYPMRWVNHYQLNIRRLGWVVSGVAVMAAGCLSLALAHYRDVAALGVIGTSGGALAMTNLLNNPFGLAELQSWILFFMGWLFWAVAAIDRYKLDDPIPGYGPVAAAKDRAYADYFQFKERMIDQLDDLRTDGEEDIKGSRRQLLNLQNQCGNLIESRKTVFLQWEEFQKAATAQCNELIETYRAANRESRSKVPKSFKNKLSLDIPNLTVFETPFDQDALAKQVADGRARLEETKEQFYEQYGAAMKIFANVETNDS